MRARGFTLLELVIASGLAVLLGGTAAALAMRGLTAARREEAALQQMFLLERTAERMGRELRNAVPAAGGRFEGAGREISFVLSEGPVSLASVRYHLVLSERGQSLIREWRPFPSENDQEPQAATLLTRVVNFSVLYGIIQQVDSRRLLKWSEVWSVPAPEPGVLPELVQVRLESEDSQGKPHSVTREFLIPQGELGSPRES